MSDTDNSSHPADGFVLTEKLVVATQPNSIQAESFRALRTNLLAQHIQKGRRALSICAPAAGMGCSHVSANLAVAMAQSGVNTLLIDGNLRDPAMDHYISGAAQRFGLADCLRDDAMPLSKAIHRVQPCLSVLFAGTPDETSFDRLGSAQFRTFFGQCLRDYELTIVDTPPTSVFADARRISALARYAMVISCRRRGYVKDIEALLAELNADGVQPIGLFLNDY